MASTGQKARYWCGVLYPENMLEDWQDEIAELVEVAGCYCIHDKDKLSPNAKKEEDRKVHVHLILVFNNSTTYKHAFSIFSRLNAEGKKACNKIEQVASIRNKYDYLIHDTADSRKKKKYQYDKSERICFNNFDIGMYEQLSAKEKNKMAKELADCINEKYFNNFSDFYNYAMSNFGEEYFEIIMTHSGFYERLCKGVYHKIEQAQTH